MGAKVDDNQKAEVSELKRFHPERFEKLDTFPNKHSCG
jgi:hypothetical protein